MSTFCDSDNPENCIPRNVKGPALSSRESIPWNLDYKRITHAGPLAQAAQVSLPGDQQESSATRIFLRRAKADVAAMLRWFSLASANASMLFDSSFAEEAPSRWRLFLASFEQVVETANPKPTITIGLQ
jgi:hypothetical protein